MKSLLLSIAAIVLMVTSDGFGQGKISFGVGADVALPITSGFSDSQNIGIGGTARVYYPLSDPMIVLTGTAGYMTFSGKDYSVAGQTVKAGSWSMIPVLVGGRYFFTPATSAFRMYGAFEMGLIFSSYTVPGYTLFGQTVGGGSVSGSDFTYQPALGFEASSWDISARYLGISGAACVAFRAGYIFN